MDVLWDADLSLDLLTKLPQLLAGVELLPMKSKERCAAIRHLLAQKKVGHDEFKELQTAVRRFNNKELSQRIRRQRRRKEQEAREKIEALEKECARLREQLAVATARIADLEYQRYLENERQRPWSPPDW